MEHKLIETGEAAFSRPARTSAPLTFESINFPESIETSIANLLSSNDIELMIGYSDFYNLDQVGLMDYAHILVKQLTLLPENTSWTESGNENNLTAEQRNIFFDVSSSFEIYINKGESDRNQLATYTILKAVQAQGDIIQLRKAIRLYAASIANVCGASVEEEILNILQYAKDAGDTEFSVENIYSGPLGELDQQYAKAAAKQTEATQSINNKRFSLNSTECLEMIEAYYSYSIRDEGNLRALKEIYPGIDNHSQPLFSYEDAFHLINSQIEMYNEFYEGEEAKELIDKAIADWNKSDPRFIYLTKEQYLAADYLTAHYDELLSKFFIETDNQLSFRDDFLEIVNKDVIINSPENYALKQFLLDKFTIYNPLAISEATFQTKPNQPTATQIAQYLKLTNDLEILDKYDIPANWIAAIGAAFEGNNTYSSIKESLKNDESFIKAYLGKSTLSKKVEFLQTKDLQGSNKLLAVIAIKNILQDVKETIEIEKKALIEITVAEGGSLELLNKVREIITNLDNLYLQFESGEITISTLESNLNNYLKNIVALKSELTKITPETATIIENKIDNTLEKAAEKIKDYETKGFNIKLEALILKTINTVLMNKNKEILNNQHLLKTTIDIPKLTAFTSASTQEEETTLVTIFEQTTKNIKELLTNIRNKEQESYHQIEALLYSISRIDQAILNNQNKNRLEYIQAEYQRISEILYEVKAEISKGVATIEVEVSWTTKIISNLIEQDIISEEIGLLLTTLEQWQAVIAKLYPKLLTDQAA